MVEYDLRTISFAEYNTPNITQMVNENKRHVALWDGVAQK